MPNPLTRTLKESEEAFWGLEKNLNADFNEVLKLCLSRIKSEITEKEFDEKRSAVDNKAIALLKSHLKDSQKKLLGAVVEICEGKMKNNCGCPPFESKHNGVCRDEDYGDRNAALKEIIKEIKEAMK